MGSTDIGCCCQKCGAIGVKLVVLTKASLIQLFFSCEETGYNGKNDIDVVGNNFWIEQVDGGSNQTYLLLNVNYK